MKAEFTAYMFALIIFCSSIFLIINSKEVEANDSLMDDDKNDQYWIKRGYDDHGSFHYQRPSMPFEPSDTPFEPIWKVPMEHQGSDTKWQWAFTGNLDNDSSMETVVKGVDRFFAVDDTGEILFDKPAPRHGLLNLVQDADGDGISEIFFSIRGVENETPRLDVFDRIGNLLKRFNFKNLQGESLNDGSPEVWTVQDIDNDGEMEIILALHASHDRYPRGIVCIGYDSWKIEANFRFAAHVSNMIFPDLDNDGVKEIVFGTSASLNGATIPATASTDLNSYVVALKYNGNQFSEYWRYKIPREIFNPMFFHTMISAVDHDGDGDMEILGYLGDKIVDQSAEHGIIFLLQGETNNRNGVLINEYHSPYPWVRPGGVADVDNDGNLETVIIGDMLGLEDDHLAVFDLKDWEIQSDIQIPDTEENWTQKPVGINDINGDGKLEIITCTIKTGQVDVYDGYLNTIWSHVSERSTSTALISDIIPGGVNEIIMIGNRITLLSLEVDLELHKVSPVEFEQYLFPGEEITCKVELENTGDITWITELSLVEEVGSNIKYIQSRFVKTPRPGGTEEFSFNWSPTNESEMVNLSVVINITEFKDGIRHFMKKVSWRIWVISEALLSKYIEIKWNCPDEALICESVVINGTISNKISNDRQIKGPVLEKIIQRVRILSVIITFHQTSFTEKISPLGGDFHFEMEAPTETGTYTVDLEISSPEKKVSIKESRTLYVKNQEEKSSSWMLLLLLLVPVFSLSGYIAIRKWKSKPILPVLPLFSREKDVSENVTRMNIYNLIMEKPGLTPQQIRRELGIRNYQTVRYHLDKLEENDMVKTKKDPSREKLLLCYPYEGRIVDPIYISDAEKLLLQMIREDPSITRKEISEVWPYSQAYLTKCIKNLQRSDFIQYQNSRFDIIHDIEESQMNAIILDDT